MSEGKAGEETLDEFIASLTDRELVAIAQESIIYDDKLMQEKTREELKRRKPKGETK